MAVPLFLAGLGVGAKTFFGDPSERRKEELELLRLAMDQDYRNRSLALQERQHELMDWTDPVSGKTYKIPQSAMGSVITGAMTAERELMGPEQIAALGTMRERLTTGKLSPDMPASAAAEAGAERVGWQRLTEASRGAGEITPVVPEQIKKIIEPGLTSLTVNAPEVSLPRTSVQEVLKESAQEKKETKKSADARLQAQSNAMFLEGYNILRSKNVPHEVSVVTASQNAQLKTGVPPEREAFPKEPTDRAERLFQKSWSDAQGNQMWQVTDVSGNVVFTKNLGQGPERTQNVSLIRYKLAQRMNNLTTGDPDIDKYDAATAAKILQDMSRVDFLAQLFQGLGIIPGGAGAPSVTPPPTAPSTPPAQPNPVRTTPRGATSAPPVPSWPPAGAGLPPPLSPRTPEQEADAFLRSQGILPPR